MSENNVDVCPGCLDCGDKCDVWNAKPGKHLWIDFADIGGMGLYSQCELCGRKEFHD